MKEEKRLFEKKELLEIFVNHRVDSPYVGDWESIFKGPGYEFWSLRKLERTDPFKNIDWKATAKTGRFHVREYLAESYFTLMILYDISKSVAFGRKEALQANIAVSLAYSTLVSNDGCGLIMFADEVKAYIPPRMGMLHFMKILRAIAKAEPVDCLETNLNKALTKLVDNVPESLTFILSDFMYQFACNYNFQRTLHGTNKHEVKALQVLEEFEIALPHNSQGLIALYDYENGENILLDLGKWEAYNEDMKRKLEETKYRLSMVGIDSSIITPEDDFRHKVNEFMKRPLQK